jgi:selenocysteine-specific elongation factor
MHAAPRAGSLATIQRMHVIGTAGHVDHGKSALVERLTGIDPDRFAEEKERGLTIDLGFAWVELPSGAEAGLIDVPGHERFIKNMLAGASGLTVCLFVVAANEGWMPQSSEHLAIVDILGIDSGVIVLTKSDLVDDSGLEAVRDSVVGRVAGTCLEGYPVVACSSVTGEGIPELLDTLDRVLAATPPAVDAGRPRMWVDRVFTIAGAGTVVTGTLAGGSLAAGDTVEIAPEGRVARIRSIQSHKREVASIAPGNRTALNLAGLERQGAQRGDAVVRPGWFRTTRLIDVELRATAIEQTRIGITEKGAHLLYVGSAEVPVRVKLIDNDVIEPGAAGCAQLVLQDPLPIQRGDRFVLRDAGRVLTLGGGRVLDPLPGPARRKDEGRVALLAALSVADGPEALALLVEEAGTIDRAEALFRAGLDAAPPEIVDSGGSSPQGIAEAGGEFISAAEAARRDLEARELDESREAGGAALVAKIEAGGFSPPMTKELGSDPALVRSLAASGELVRIGDFYLTARTAGEARAKVREHISTHGPVTVAEIRDLLGTTRKYVVPLCEWLDATGATRRTGDLRTHGPTP